MHISGGFGEIFKRALAIRLPPSQLAVLAGVDRSTVTGIKSGRSKEPYASTRDKVEGALVAEERRLAIHLLALHPDLATGHAPTPDPLTPDTRHLTPAPESGR